MIVSKINPFATRYVRPGMVEWIASEFESLEQLQQRFEVELCRRAAVVGPHGTGKSTLLEHLGPRLGRIVYRESPASVAGLDVANLPQLSGKAAVGRQATAKTATKQIADCPITWLSLRRGDQAAERVKLSRRHWRAGGLLILDGFEQLSWFTRWYTIRLTRQRKMGLLVTCHQPIALEPLIEMRPSLLVMQKVIEQVGRNAGQPIPPELIAPPVIEQLLIEERGNIREVLMRLYDMLHQALPR